MTGGEILEKRNRNIPIFFRVTQEEREQIEVNMERAGITSLRAYLLKMALSGYIIQLDLAETREFTTLLRSVSNNMNQIAKRANETRSIYESDIKDLQEQYAKLWTVSKDILRTLADLQG